MAKMWIRREGTVHAVGRSAHLPGHVAPFFSSPLTYQYRMT